MATWRYENYFLVLKNISHVRLVKRTLAEGADHRMMFFKVSANPKLTVLHNFGFLNDSINLRNSFRLKKNSQKNVIRTGSYLAKTILLS